MKYILAFATLFSSVLVFGSVDDKACLEKDNKILEMNIRASNIANINTTRVTGGGPYRRREVICFEQICHVKENSESINVYLPNHPHANENGYVSYPNINLQQEIDAIIQAQLEYNEAIENCN